MTSEAGIVHSRAFENLVQGDRDIVGMLAYALYKRAIREEKLDGRDTPSTMRNPSPTVVSAYRMAAERQLGDLMDENLASARPEMQASAMLQAITSSTSDLKEHITRRTGPLQAMVTNLAAWAITLVLTVLIVVGFSRPDPVTTLKSAAETFVPPGPAVP